MSECPEQYNNKFKTEAIKGGIPVFLNLDTIFTCFGVQMIHTYQKVMESVQSIASPGSCNVTVCGNSPRDLHSFPTRRSSDLSAEAEVSDNITGRHL